MRKLLFSFIATVIATTFVCCSGEDYEMYEGGISTYATQTRSMRNELLPPLPPSPPEDKVPDTTSDSIEVYSCMDFDTMYYQSMEYDIRIHVSCEGKVFYSDLSPQLSLHLENKLDISYHLNYYITQYFVSGYCIDIYFIYSVAMTPYPVPRITDAIRIPLTKVKIPNINKTIWW